MEKDTPSWFVVLSYEILTSKELTDKEKLLMGLISSLQGEQGYCFANNKYLADRLNCSPETIKHLITNLVSINWLNRKIYRNENNEFTKRILTIKMTKIQSEFEATPLRPNLTPPPPAKTDPTSGQKTPSLIYNINKEEEEKAKSKNLENLQTLEEIIEISNEVSKDNIWLEQICMNMSTKIEDVVKWMNIFNLSISNQDISNITLRKYKSLFLGWLRSKYTAGIKLSDFKMDGKSNTGPTKIEVSEEFIRCGGNNIMAKAFFDRHEATGWFLKGSPITSFKSLVPSFITNWVKNESKGGNNNTDTKNVKIVC